MVKLVSPYKQPPPATGQTELSYTPLERHAASPAGSDFTLQTRMSLAPEGELELQFQLLGNIADIVVPEQKSPRRADDLWRRTCFEAFIKNNGDDAYWEINLSPSREWAVYRFSAYRTGMCEERTVSPPNIAVNATPTMLELTARFAAAPFADYPAKNLRFNLTAVVEHITGEKSHWAARHAENAPDFHLAECFTGAIF